MDKYAVVEKPLTGYFGDGSPGFNGYASPKEPALEEARLSVQRMIEAEKRSKGRLLYAENWVYAPAIQKEKEIIEKTDAQILWMHGEEAHSGSHSPVYGQWSQAGGGSKTFRSFVRDTLRNAAWKGGWGTVEKETNPELLQHAAECGMLRDAIYLFHEAMKEKKGE